LFCSLKSFATNVAPRAYAVWFSTTAIAQIPFQAPDPERPVKYVGTVEGPYSTAYIEMCGLVAEVHIDFYKWVAHGCPSSFCIVYSDGRKTEIIIPSYNSYYPSGNSDTTPVLIQLN